MLQTLSATFVAALRSVGTAGTMAMAGFYLHQRGFVNSDGKKALARLSQQVTIPALFFSKIIYCPQNFSQDKCPDIIENLGDVWVLILWPLFVVGCGLVVGELAARWSKTPPSQRKSVIAACAFANSTGLPITLLTVVHANFPATSELGRVDPNLFLSVYLLIYPILQWGIGGWLLATGENSEDTDLVPSSRNTGVHHVLNLPADAEHSPENVAARMIRELSLSDLKEARGRGGSSTAAETTSLCQQALESGTMPHHALANPDHDVVPLVYTIAKVVSKALQPPVIGALLGLLIASVAPLRGLFVDLNTRSNKAPLEWLFDGIHSVGLAAVPINMAILGINLSLASQKKKVEEEGGGVSRATIVAIVIGKMVVMPTIGIVSALILKNYIWNIPDDIDAPFYLVLMIVTITPTANNVMIMVELSGSGAKEGMARIIGWQYACAPLLLSITVMLVVRVAVLW